ncbi:MAG: redox-sensitive bicupin YhaK (pirin superfamily) [Oceanicoccus sp.]|jgi:redox-sensitive bicupin YhaK (pirin superfamily)
MRTIQTLLNPQDAMDGAGVKIKRHSIVRLGLADPFLMLDEIRSDDPNDFIAGFPPHPHRGIETLTYMRVGGIRHEDNMGNTGQVLSGGAQWMRAGKGVIHGEMPLKEHDKMHGFQLWINLNSQNKMIDPDYRDVPKEEIVHVETQHYLAHALAGSWQLGEQKVTGPLDRLEANSAMLDLELNAGGDFGHDIPDDHHLIMMVYEGEIQVGDKSVARPQMAVFSQAGVLRLHSENGGKALILHGLPHKEPIANYGPFVMNTAAEIDQAIADYQNGVLA